MIRLNTVLTDQCLDTDDRTRHIYSRCLLRRLSDRRALCPNSPECDDDCYDGGDGGCCGACC